MKTDAQLQSDVIAELKWNSAIDASKIGVEVSDGIVTLSGQVNDYSQKWSAERAAQKVWGVKALTIKIDVILPGSSKRTDTDIARTAENVLEWTANLPHHRIQVMVENGWITLSGELDYDYQRELAASAVRHLLGVTGVSNLITVKSVLSAASVKSDIQAALKRRALTDADEIAVTVNGGKVTLTGVVHSWSERDMVNEAAWNTVGVSEVDNHITVAY